ncbi:c-type cytochrome [Chitinophaga flava]|uniref:Nitric oxide reductase n=1 Tax=Chitinophaga flava TaxID=2259036 RepID=A0A365XZE4_9BACT|nr:cytochrome c [Chitinophaga flava]RBL91703.1 nitric oxide reductase [Chitinophaga flava]
MLTKSSARIFFLGGTIVTFLIFIGLSWHTLSKDIPHRTHQEKLTPSVIAGKRLFEANNCMGCHTIMGEGGYYAPELTKVVERRGEAYIKVVLGSKMPWAPRGRKMVAYGFNEMQAQELYDFLKWVGEMDLNGFPPKPNYKSTINTK